MLRGTTRQFGENGPFRNVVRYIFGGDPRGAPPDAGIFGGTSEGGDLGRVGGDLLRVFYLVPGHNLYMGGHHDHHHLRCKPSTATLATRDPLPGHPPRHRRDGKNSRGAHRHRLDRYLERLIVEVLVFLGARAVGAEHVLLDVPVGARAIPELPRDGGDAAVIAQHRLELRGIGLARLREEVVRERPILERVLEALARVDPGSR